MHKSKERDVEKIEIEHRGLNREIAQLKASLQAPTSEEDFSQWRLRCLWQLRDFKNRLMKHFDLEELGGFMTEVVLLKPEFSIKVSKLKNEHLVIEESLDKIVGELRRTESSNDSALDVIRVAVKELMEMLDKHENEEHRLLQQAYNREYGGPA